MTVIHLWPESLAPAQIAPNQVAFSRSGGRSLGGLERTIRTDRGWWTIDYKGVMLSSTAIRRTWNAIRTSLGGMAGLLAIPVLSYDSNGEPAGTVGGRLLIPHSDGTGFSDGSYYTQPAIVVEMAAAASLGDTSISLRIVSNIDELSGVRFSYNHALYETGNPTSIVDDVWTVDIFPAIRADIPEDAVLEFDVPTCLVHLANDRAMDLSFSAGKLDRVDVSFVEAVDYWNDLAAIA